MGEGEQPLARGERAEHVLTLVGGAAGLDQAAGEDHRVEVGLGGDDAADLLAHDGDLDRTGTDPAVLLGERQAQQAHLGHLRPDLLAEAGVSLAGLASLLEVGVGLAEQPADRVAQGVLLVVVGEVHVRSASQSPRIVRAMIWRCTSLEPP